jgi:hypothetical protein
MAHALRQPAPLLQSTIFEEAEILKFEKIEKEGL